jgi:pSer/pThr/pTyr-binding forkhead associated (FHA) protein
MITCPNCAHANPETATECEACYTPLPALISCPNCSATVSAAAHFCGQCGHDLQQGQAQGQSPLQPLAPPSQPLAPTVIGSTGNESSMPQHPGIPDQVALPPDVPPALSETSAPAMSSTQALGSQPPELPEPAAQMEPAVSQNSPNVSPIISGNAASGETALPDGTQPPPAPAAASMAPDTSTRLQQTAARLFHIQSDSVFELPLHVNVIHIGKPNGQIPPDIDLSGVPDSDIVSRVHADIRVEGDTFYLEDLGSSNGTYVNNLPLQPGDRHRLRPGDRIALGKGDKVSFLFQFS